jgi:hypothetical protein
MTRFVKLREGAEAFAVNTDQICSLEGVAGGRETLVNTANGGSVRLHISIDECLARLAPTPEDWLEKPAAAKGKGNK